MQTVQLQFHPPKLIKPSEEKTTLCWLSLLVFFLLFLQFGCTKTPLRKAFGGKLEPTLANKVTTEYCQGCHNHRFFEPNEHVIENSKLYRENYYSRAKECRICHSIKVDFWGHIDHNTTYPAFTEKSG